ncbi:MAG: hypothetical protein JF627_08475 [Alphaproteobacteria bacterium]|nr:hypothetical protein [Alphaproteobacteria bacterium]
MKKILAIAAFVALGMTSAQAQTPQPADWTILTFTADLNKPADIGWERVGGNDWCGIVRFLDLKGCTINSGKGELGSVRTVIVGTTNVVEIAVARTAHSYTYAQPFTPIFYHGTMAVEPVDAGHSKLVYTLMWNQTAVGDAKAQSDARESRQRRFQAAVDKMAAAANAP